MDIDIEISNFDADTRKAYLESTIDTSIKFDHESIVTTSSPSKVTFINIPAGNYKLYLHRDTYGYARFSTASH